MRRHGATKGGRRTEMAEHTVVVVGGTHGLGRDLAQHYADAGRRVVVTGRDAERAAAAAAELGASVEGLAFDLADPATIAAALAGVGSVDRLVLAALERDLNTVKDYDIGAALRLVTLKLVGYTEVIHSLLAAAHPRCVDPPVRRAREAPPVPRFDDDHHDQPRGRRAGPEPRDGDRADPRERAPPGDRRRQPLLGAEDRGPRGDEGQDADGTPRHDARRHRRGRVPPREPVDARERDPDRRRLVPHMTPRVAVLGAGNMAGAMVGTLRRAGFDVTVWNRTRERADSVAETHGATTAASAAEAVAAADVVLSSLADDEAVLATYLGDEGAAIACRTRPRRAGDEHGRACHLAPGRRGGRRERRRVPRRPGIRERADRREGRAHDHGRRGRGRARAGPAGPRRTRREGLPRRRAREPARRSSSR